MPRRASLNPGYGVPRNARANRCRGAAFSERSLTGRCCSARGNSRRRRTATVPSSHDGPCGEPARRRTAYNARPIYRKPLLTWVSLQTPFRLPPIASMKLFSANLPGRTRGTLKRRPPEGESASRQPRRVSSLIQNSSEKPADLSEEKWMDLRATVTILPPNG